MQPSSSSEQEEHLPLNLLLGVVYDFFIGGCIHEFHCAHDFFRLAPLGNPVFGNVEIFFDPKIRQLHSPGG